MEALSEYDGSQDPKDWVNRIQAYCLLHRTFTECEMVDIALLRVNKTIEFDRNVSTLGDLITALRSCKQYKLHLQCMRDKLSAIKYNGRDDLFGFVNLIRNWVFELGLKNDVSFVRKCLINASTNKTIRKDFEEKSSDIDDVGSLLDTFYSLNANLNQCIKYGDTIILKHVRTEKYLSSNTDRYSSGSEFQIAYASKEIYHKDNYWTVQPAGRPQEEYVRYNTRIMLRHVATGETLSSHGIKSPVTKQQEVCCFGQHDSNNYWIPLLFSDPESNELWKVDDVISMKHIETDGKLHSHGHFLTGSRQEVTCYHHNDVNDQWQVVLKD